MAKLKTFEVWVTREIRESARVVIKAKNKEEAEEKALADQWNLPYETDDYVGETYAASVEEIDPTEA